MIVADWPAPPRVRAMVTTRGEALPALPAAPAWLRQVHGTGVLDAARVRGEPEADAAFTRARNVVCAVKVADCLPVFFAHESGSTVAAAHAGWRGLAAGILEATLDALAADPERLLAWLGPAIGPRVYEIGAEVRAAFLDRDPALAPAFSPTRPGHWLLDLYAAARHRLAARGLRRVFGGGFCTYSEPQRFHSWRRERGAERMAALIWIESPGP